MKHVNHLFLQINVDNYWSFLYFFTDAVILPMFVFTEWLGL